VAFTIGSMHAPVPESNPPPVLNARGLACRRGRRTLFRGLDMQLRPGSITWLRGTNGSGKTSLMRILAGLSAATEGVLQWCDGAGGQLIYIGHSNALKDDLTLAEALAFLARLQGLDDADARAHRALGLLGLASRREQPVRTLSQGQRRRGALARLALDDELAVATMSNANDSEDFGSRYTRPIRKLLAKGLSLPASNPALPAYAGRYSDQPWESETVIVPWGEQLALLHLPTRDPAGDLQLLKPVGPDQFRALRDDGSLAEAYRFRRNAAGEVEAVESWGQLMRRVAPLR